MRGVVVPSRGGRLGGGERCATACSTEDVRILRVGGQEGRGWHDKGLLTVHAEKMAGM